jgi:membrane protein implicated in regulation of membrane protease activity
MASQDPFSTVIRHGHFAVIYWGLFAVVAIVVIGTLVWAPQYAPTTGVVSISAVFVLMLGRRLAARRLERDG